MKRRIQIALLIALVFAANGVAFPFGGENPLGPGENIHITAQRKNWHHQDIAYDALIAAGFRAGPPGKGQGAAESITWHADYIDSYLYNPLFWIPGGLDRFKVALATEPELLKLHFDDNFSLPAVQAAFRKYVTGTLAGLMWAKQRDDVASAHNIIGVSLHAMADFYAHSNWVDDPARRQKTWFDFTPSERAQLPIYVGSYEEPEQLGVKHHGKILPICTLIKGGMVEQVLNVGCSGLSPFTKATICDHHRECKRAVKVNPPAEVAGVKLPQGLVYSLPGIALDSSWQAPIGYKMRGLKDSNPQEIFQTAKTLAKKHSTHWLRLLEYHMKKLHAGDFWEKCQETSTFAQRHVPYENYSKFPYTFLSAGRYPLNPRRMTRSVGEEPIVPFAVAGTRAGLETQDRPVDGVNVSRLQNNQASGATEVDDQPLEPKPFPVKAPAKFLPAIAKIPVVPVAAKPPAGAPTGGPVKDEFYLRVQLKTSTDTYSGTDSDIILHAGGRQFLLDYMPRENPLIAYNDLENGDHQVYVVGPFDSVPSSITLENRSASAGEVFEAFGKAFVEAILTIIEKIGDFFMSLVGGHADYVGQKGLVWEPDQLAGIGSKPVAFSRTIDGGDEGRFTVHGTIERTNESSIGHPSSHWAEYEINLKTFECHKESKIDRLSDSDEPFLLSLMVPFPGTVKRNIRGPYEDVDAGESRSIGQKYSSGRIPKTYGRVSVQFQVWESDDESAKARGELLDKFAGKTEDATKSSERGLLDTIGAALAADWKLAHMEVYAFGRGSRVYAGTVFNQTVNTWIEGKERKKFDLNAAACRDLGVTAEELQATTIPGRSATVGPAVPLKEGRNSARSQANGNTALGVLIPALGIAGLIAGLAACGFGRRYR